MKIAVLLFSVTLVLLTVFSYTFVDANFFALKNLYTGFATERRNLVTLFYVIFILVLYGLYIVLLRQVEGNKVRLEQLKKIILLSSVILFFSYPAMLSYDIFNYMTTSKVAFFYKENPYIVMPIDFTSDPNLMFTRAANKIALYGPSWITLTGIPHFLGFGNIILTLFTFKLLITSSYILTVWLIWKLSKSLFSVAIFALSPLVLIETLVSSHNDIVMMFLALLSFYWLKKRRLALAVLTFIGSILIKYATVALLPVFLYSLYLIWRKKRIDWGKIYAISAISMYIVVVLSPLREELYPWYIIWVLAFVSLIPEKRFLHAFTIVLSFGALLRYIPVLYTGSYSGITPLIREVATIIPITSVSLFFIYKKWVKRMV